MAAVCKALVLITKLLCVGPG